MSSDLILESAEIDLRQVVQALIAAEPDRLEDAQKLLESMVGALGSVETSARQCPSANMRKALHELRAGLSVAETLSRGALRTIDRQAELAGLHPSAASWTIQMEA